MNLLNKYKIVTIKIGPDIYVSGAEKKGADEWRLNQLNMAQLFQSFQRTITTCVVFFIVILPGTHLFSQITNQNDVIAKTTVEYDSCSTTATITFPLNSDGVCLSIAGAATVMRWMEIYDTSPTGSETLAGKVSASGFSHEGSCAQIIYTTPDGFYCRGWDLCSDGNVLDFELLQYTEVPGGTFAERYARLKIPSLTGIIRLVGDYDGGISGGDNGFDVNFVKQDLSPGNNQCTSINHIFLGPNIQGTLVNVPGFVRKSLGYYPASWNTLNINTFPFEGWLKAESFGGYNTTLDYTVIVDNPNQTGTIVQIEVLYHRNFGQPNQTTRSIGLGGPGQLVYIGTRTESSGSIPLDLDSLDGSKMDVIECVHRVNGVTTANALIPIVVSGLVSREVPPVGSMVTPQIPYLILHDPPGDGSMTTFTAGEKVCREVTTSYQEEIGGGFTATGKVGLAGSIGVVLEQGFEFSVAIEQKFGLTHKNLTEQTTERCIEILNTFNTSDLPENIGEDADIFVGYGETWIYGTYEEVLIPSINEVLAGADSASIYKGLAYARADTGKTTFILTAKLIEDDIKKQFAVANDMSQNLVTRTRAYNQMKLWEQVLALNADNVKNASVQYGSDFSFSGSSNSMFEEEITTTESTTLTYDMAIEVGTNITFTAIVGANGFTGGPQFTFNQNEGTTTSNDTTNKQLVKYTLADDDNLDIFPISVFKDPSYGTPIFRLNPGARTSYPYEGGYRRDQPKLQTDITICSEDLGIVDNVPYGSAAGFNLEICNESDESRDYRFQLNNNANTGGATVKASGTVLNSGAGFLNFTVPPNTCLSPSLDITVERNSAKPLPGQPGYEPEDDVYEDLVFILYPYKVSTDETFPFEAVEYTAKVSFGPNNVFIDDACNTTQSCYDFENLSYGPVDGQDNWKVFNAVANNLATQPIINLLPDTLGSRNLAGPQDGFLLTWSSRKNDNNFSLPTMGACSQLIRIEFDMFLPNDTNFISSFLMGADANNDGNLTLASTEAGFGLQVNHSGTQVNLQCLGASGAPVGSEAIIALFGDTYYRFRLDVSPAANNGGGTANVFFKNLIDGSSWIKAANIDDVSLGLDASHPTSPNNVANIDGFLLRLQNSLANIDNICVTNVNYQTKNCTNCLESIAVDQPIIADNVDYEAAKAIISNTSISGNASVIYSAKEQIQLNQGFDVKMGSELLVDLEGCQTTMMKSGVPSQEKQDKRKQEVNETRILGINRKINN